MHPGGKTFFVRRQEYWNMEVSEVSVPLESVRQLSCAGLIILGRVAPHTCASRQQLQAAHQAGASAGCSLSPSFEAEPPHPPTLTTPVLGPVIPDRQDAASVEWSVRVPRHLNKGLATAPMFVALMDWT